MKDQLIKQANKEFGAFATYKAAALWCRNQAFFGCEKWLTKAANEELEHMKTFTDYLADLHDFQMVEGIQDRKAEYKSLKDVFDAVLALEIEVTKSIHALYTEALKSDLHAVALLHPFLDEQLDSVRTCKDIVQRLSVSTVLTEFDEWIEEQ